MSAYRENDSFLNNIQHCIVKKDLENVLVSGVAKHNSTNLIYEARF